MLLTVSHYHDQRLPQSHVGNGVGAASDRLCPAVKLFVVSRFCSFVIAIRKTETVPQLGEVVHLSIFGIKVKSAFAPTRFTPSILLQPFSGGPLRASLKQRITRATPAGDGEFAYDSLNDKHDGHPLIPVLAAHDRSRGGPNRFPPASEAGVEGAAVRNAPN